MRKPATKDVTPRRVGKPTPPPAALTIPTETQEFARKQALTVSKRTPALVVITNDSQNEAASEYRSSVIKPAIDRIQAETSPLKTMAHQLHKGIVELEKKMLDPLVAADRQLKGAMEKYAMKVIEAQRAQVRQLQSSMNVEAREQAAQEAQALLEQGDEQGADAILDRLAAGEVQASSALTFVGVRRGPATSSSSTRLLPRYELLDPAQLKREFLIPNEKAIQAIVDSAREGAVALVSIDPSKPAIRFVEKPSVATRSS